MARKRCCRSAFRLRRHRRDLHQSPIRAPIWGIAAALAALMSLSSPSSNFGDAFLRRILFRSAYPGCSWLRYAALLSTTMRAVATLIFASRDVATASSPDGRAGADPMLKTAAIVPEEQRLVLSSLSPGPAQKRLALAIVLGISVVFVLITVGLLSGVQARRIDAFLPAYLTCDVRLRFDHRDPAVRPVFHSALARNPRDRERVSLHGAYPDPVRPDVSRRVCAHGPDWRAAEFGMDVRVVACWLSPVRRRLCACQRMGVQTSGFGRARRVRRSPGVSP